MALNGLAAINEIDDFISRHEQRHEDLNQSELHDLGIVRRDAIHSLLQQHDAWLFSEFDRLKLVELEYLYQVRGVRQVMPSAIFREGYEGYGNSWTGSKIRLLYPQDRKRGGRESREPFLPINKVIETENLTEQRIPLRIDLSTEKYRLKDRILWNVDDTTIPLELFVENVLEDYGLPLSLAPDVSKSLQEQISNHLPHIYPHPPAAGISDRITEEGPITTGSSSIDTADARPENAQVTSEVPTENSTSLSTNADAPMADAGTGTAPINDTDIAGSEAANTEAAQTIATGASEGPETAPVDANMGTGDSVIAEEAKTEETKVEEANVEEAKVEVAEGDPAKIETTEDDTTKDDTSKDDAANSDPAVKATATSAAAAPPTESTTDKVKNEVYDEDLRITIKLNITIGQHQLVDQFEWDINNPDNDPEMFGVILANELALPLEFSTAISHAIREQSQAYTRALFSSGYQFDGKPPHDQQLQNETAMPVGENSFLRRPELLPLFSPALNDVKMTALDPEEQEAEKRELRSRRRQGRSRRNHHGHHHHHDSRSGGSALNNGEFVSLSQEHRGPDFCTPVYSSVLPGGLDRNLSIFHMTLCQNDDVYGGDKQDLVYYFNKHRRERGVQSASQFDESMLNFEKPRWMVKMKIPKRGD